MSYDADQLADRERHVRRDGDAGNLKSRSDGILNHRLNEVWVSCFSVTLLVKVDLSRQLWRRSKFEGRCGGRAVILGGRVAECQGPGQGR